ncbi:hypothetical protein BU26DRAFT_12224 [Trematosphaeria pertusa]|uniref:Uncharacterized protein n=1 Tax=Trematosphaeria pertusa TaxID=390896 RepID=A0A6A6IZC0_9PLEO|nr:uncharacterized protein BU26DRAFT_12224 [Trematosphaeria pertusa]KAF2255941.1 hypothetical protein BU26DRAFT_12224 [Trematosphaeria pertusa]
MACNVVSCASFFGTLFSNTSRYLDIRLIHTIYPSLSCVAFASSRCCIDCMWPPWSSAHGDGFGYRGVEAAFSGPWDGMGWNGKGDGWQLRRSQ